MAEHPEVNGRTAVTDGFSIGEDLQVVMVEITKLKEQDVNAQVMSPRHFDRLTENIRLRGGLESMPYCHRADISSPIEIVSGHHRARAARAAGLTSIPVILDTRKMRRSEIVAKQLAHNALSGEPDNDVLAALVAMIDDVDDLLMTGLEESQLPSVDSAQIKLDLPQTDFDWRLVPLMFLPSQMEDFTAALENIDRDSALLGYGGDVEAFSQFAKAVHNYGRAIEVRNMSTTVAAVVQMASQELADRAEAGKSTGQAGDGEKAGPMEMTVDLLPRVLPARVAEKLRKVQSQHPERSALEVLEGLLDTALLMKGPSSHVDFRSA